MGTGARWTGRRAAARWPRGCWARTSRRPAASSARRATWRPSRSAARGWMRARTPSRSALRSTWGSTATSPSRARACARCCRRPRQAACSRPRRKARCPRGCTACCSRGSPPSARRATPRWRRCSRRCRTTRRCAGGAGGSPRRRACWCSPRWPCRATSPAASRPRATPRPRASRRRGAPRAGRRWSRPSSRRRCRTRTRCSRACSSAWTPMACSGRSSARRPAPPRACTARPRSTSSRCAPSVSSGGATTWARCWTSSPRRTRRRWRRR